MVENHRNARNLETVSLTWSSISSSRSAWRAMIPVKAQVFLPWINLFAVGIMNTTLAIFLRFRKANNQNLKIWLLTEVAEILGSPAWNSKCQMQRCRSVLRMEQGRNSSGGYTGQSRSGAAPLYRSLERRSTQWMSSEEGESWTWPGDTVLLVHIAV